MSSRIWHAYVYRGFIPEVEVNTITNLFDNFNNSWIKLFSGISRENVLKRIIALSKSSNRIYRIAKSKSIYNYEIDLTETYPVNNSSPYDFYQYGKIYTLPKKISQNNSPVDVYKSIIEYFTTNVNTEEPTYAVIFPLRYRESETLEQYLFDANSIQEINYRNVIFSNYLSDLKETLDSYRTFMYVLKDGFMYKYFDKNKEISKDTFYEYFRKDFLKIYFRKFILTAPDLYFPDVPDAPDFLKTAPRANIIFENPSLEGMYKFILSYTEYLKRVYKSNENNEIFDEETRKVFLEHLNDLESCIPELHIFVNSFRSKFSNL